MSWAVAEHSRRWPRAVLAAAVSLASVRCGGSPPSPTTAPPPPTPEGCITEVAAGAHTFTCEGLHTDLFVPSACERPGCGLILELHGDTGTGPLIDANTDLMARGAAGGYLVVAPTGPPRDDGLGPTWTLAEDDKLIAIVQAVARVFRTDQKRTHLTGFSRGGYVTWRLLCQHAELFASAAPGAAGSSPGGACQGVPEVSCPFDAAVAGGMPSRPVPVLFLIGRTDVPVPYACAARLRDQAIVGWNLGAPQMLSGDLQYVHTRWTASASSALLETFEHSYETVPDGPDAAFKGHCIPGSTFDPYAPAYAVACAPPSFFTWGAEVIRFFDQHPGPVGSADAGRSGAP
jgi:poly(3-hydroxybutyrate) depolymerase